MIYIFLGNLGRRLAEWADQQAEKKEANTKHVIDLVRTAWLGNERAPVEWYGS